MAEQSITPSEQPEANNPLVLDLLEWIGPNPRPYADVMEAWRTSCPRLTIWEDAIDLCYVNRQFLPGRGDTVTVTRFGLEALETHRPRRAA